MPPRNTSALAISFIVPARNAASTLDACLTAILATRSGNARREVLLIDNGSADETAAIATRDGVIVISAPGMRVGALRNLGARLSTGDILAFVDADCVIAPDWIERALDSFADPDVGAVGSPTHVSENPTWVELAWALHRHRANRPGPVSWLPTENLLVRKAAFLDVGGFNEALVTCEDVDLCYRLGVRYRIQNDPELRSVHLGEAKSLRRFFTKELWRGRGNLAGLRSHSIRLSELPSVLLPVYQALGTIALLGTIGYGSLRGVWTPTAIAAGLLVLPGVLLALITTAGTRRPAWLPPLAVLYSVYATARAIAMAAGAFDWWRAVAGSRLATDARARSGSADAVTGFVVRTGGKARP